MSFFISLHLRQAVFLSRILYIFSLLISRSSSIYIFRPCEAQILIQHPEMLIIPSVNQYKHMFPEQDSNRNEYSLRPRKFGFWSECYLVCISNYRRPQTKSLFIKVALSLDLRKIMAGAYLHVAERVLLERPPLEQLHKDFPTYYGTRSFIPVSTGDLNWLLF